MLLSIFAWSGHAGAPVVSLQAVATLYSAARFAPCARAAFFLPNPVFGPSVRQPPTRSVCASPRRGRRTPRVRGAHTRAQMCSLARVGRGFEFHPRRVVHASRPARVSARNVARRGAAPRTSRSPRRRVAVERTRSRRRFESRVISITSPGSVTVHIHVLALYLHLVVAVGGGGGGGVHRHLESFRTGSRELGRLGSRGRDDGCRDDHERADAEPPGNHVAHGENIVHVAAEHLHDRGVDAGTGLRLGGARL